MDADEVGFRPLDDDNDGSLLTPRALAAREADLILKKKAVYKVGLKPGQSKKVVPYEGEQPVPSASPRAAAPVAASTPEPDVAVTATTTTTTTVVTTTTTAATPLPAAAAAPSSQPSLRKTEVSNIFSEASTPKPRKKAGFAGTVSVDDGSQAALTQKEQSSLPVSTGILTAPTVTGPTQAAADPAAVVVDRARRPSSRKSLHEKAVQSFAIRGQDTAALTDDNIAEHLGNSFNSLWSAMGLGSVATKIKDKISEAVDVSGVYPSEVLERITAGYPKKAFVTYHPSLQPVAGIDPQKPLVPTSTSHDDSSTPQLAMRRKAQKLDAAAIDPIHAFGLSHDEVCYFYGAFCEAAGDPADPPTQILLQDLCTWFFKVPGRFHLPAIEDWHYRFLMETVHYVHYWDGHNNKGKGKEKLIAVDDYSLSATSKPLEPSELTEAPTAPPPKLTPAEESALMLEKVRAEGERLKNQALAEKQKSRPPTYMTFFDFVISLWVFCTADETIIAKLAWEFVEVGKLGKMDETGTIPFENGKDVVMYYMNEKDWDKAKRAKKVLEDLEKKAIEINGSKVLPNGGFVDACNTTRSFQSALIRFQVEVQSCVMGSHFWKRQGKFRLEKYGYSTLHQIALGNFVDMKASLMKEAQASEEEEKRQEQKEQAKTTLEEAGEAEEDERPEEIKEKKLKVVRQSFHEKREVMRLGRTILLVDKKLQNGETLTAEEAWLHAKANAQAKTANKLYMRASRIVQDENKREWFSGGRALQEGDEEDEDEDEDESGEDP